MSENYNNNGGGGGANDEGGALNDGGHVGELENYLEEEGDPDAVDDIGDDKEEEDSFEFEVKGSVCNVKIDNCDLSAIVNGFPGDPIELRPFDKIFTRKNIWSWWCKVGFIPMNRNALNNDKVRQQLGEYTAAVGGQGERLKILVEDYNKAAQEVTNLGFKGDYLDLEMDVAVPRALIKDETERIKKIVEEKAANKMGRLFKLGCQVANERVITESCKIIIAEEAQAKAQRLETKMKKEDATKSDASQAYKKIITKGNLETALLPKDWKSILKFLLFTFAPNERMAEYSTGAKALARL